MFPDKNILLRVSQFHLQCITIHQGVRAAKPTRNNYSLKENGCCVFPDPSSHVQPSPPPPSSQPSSARQFHIHFVLVSLFGIASLSLSLSLLDGQSGSLSVRDTTRDLDTLIERHTNKHTSSDPAQIHVHTNTQTQIVCFCFRIGNKNHAKVIHCLWMIS